MVASDPNSTVHTTIGQKGFLTANDFIADIKDRATYDAPSDRYVDGYGLTILELSQMLGIKISDAQNILRELEKELAKQGIANEPEQAGTIATILVSILDSNGDTQITQDEVLKKQGFFSDVVDSRLQVSDICEVFEVPEWYAQEVMIEFFHANPEYDDITSENIDAFVSFFIDYLDDPEKSIDKKKAIRELQQEMQIKVQDTQFVNDEDLAEVLDIPPEAARQLLDKNVLVHILEIPGHNKPENSPEYQAALAEAEGVIKNLQSPNRKQATEALFRIIDKIDKIDDSKGKLTPGQRLSYAFDFSNEIRSSDLISTFAAAGIDISPDLANFILKYDAAYTLITGKPGNGKGFRGKITNKEDLALLMQKIDQDPRGFISQMLRAVAEQAKKETV